VSLPEISRRQALVLVAFALAALFLAGKLLGRGAAAEPARPARLQTLAPAPKQLLYVDVAGEVRRPGLYRFPSGARVNDAVERAGGAKAGADLTLVNLAAPLADGQQVLVPARAPAAAAGPAANTPAAAGGRVHLNIATLEQLDALPGIGPSTAQRIIDYRTENGPFTSVDELDNVSGIGPARLEELRDLVMP
jgi:competence protein ComEA